jgi:hypothetical protein
VLANLAQLDYVSRSSSCNEATCHSTLARGPLGTPSTYPVPGRVLLSVAAARARGRPVSAAQIARASPLAACGTLQASTPVSYDELVRDRRHLHAHCVSLGPWQTPHVASPGTT